MISPLTALATIILITHAIALPQREASLNPVDLLKRQHDLSASKSGNSRTAQGSQTTPTISQSVQLVHSATMSRPIKLVET